MVQIHEATSRYLIQWPKLGDATPTFTDDPWKYFYKNLSATRQAPFIEVSTPRLVRKTGTGTCLQINCARSPSKPAPRCSASTA